MDTATVSEQPVLITLEQAAQRLAISRRTLERLIATGEFPSPFKIGGASRLAIADIDTYCAERMYAERRADERAAAEADAKGEKEEKPE